MPNFFWNGPQIPNFFWNGPQIIIWFIVFTTILALFANKFVSLAKEICICFNLSNFILGGIILTITTSTPELINGIVSGIIDNNKTLLPKESLLSLYNVAGANSLLIVVLVITILFNWIKYHSTNFYSTLTKTKSKHRQNYFLTTIKIMKKNFVIWLIIMSQLIIMTLMLFIPKIAKIFTFAEINFVLIGFIIIWLIMIIWNIKYKKENVQNNVINLSSKYTKWKIINLLFFTFLIFLLFISIIYINLKIVGKFEGIFKIHYGVSSAILLSLATSLPEIFTFYFLVRQKKYDVGVEEIIGSILFNLVILGITNVISKNNLISTGITKILSNNSTTEFIKFSAEKCKWLFLMHTFIWSIFGSIFLSKIIYQRQILLTMGLISILLIYLISMSFIGINN